MLTPRHPCAVRVERGFATLAHGRVHYRAAGEGPVVVALHESPRSSLSLLPVLEALSDRHRVIAPDTPGYGLSDALIDADPDLDAFADALLAFMEALGLGRVALYGAHTGAAIATTFAVRYPERVARLVLDGVSVFTPKEVEAFRTHYLPPYSPHWDGRHVMSLWSRVRDLYTWFPWHDRTAERRLPFDAPPLEVLDWSMLGFVQAGPHYHKAYIRAAAFDPGPALAQVKAPIVIMARPTDLIASHLDRIQGDFDVRRLAPGDDAWRDGLRKAMGNEAEATGRAPSPSEAGAFVEIGEGWMNLYRGGPPRGPLRVLLPDFPGDAADLLAKEISAAPGAYCIAFDLPGCGWSDPLENDADILNATLDVLEEVLAARQDRFDAQSTVVAEGASAVLAALWRERRRQRGQSLFALEIRRPPAWFADPKLLPPTPPLVWATSSWDGAHFTGAWFQLRDRLMCDGAGVSGDRDRALDGAGPSIDRLDRMFRLYVEGPDSARLLAECIDTLRRRPDLSG